MKKVLKGLKINSDNTKFRTISTNDILNNWISVNGEDFEQVMQFKYLECVINQNRDPNQEISYLLEQTRITFSRLQKLLSDKDLNLTIWYSLFIFLIRHSD